MSLLTDRGVQLQEAPDAAALFREAQQRERRRRLLVLLVVVLVVGGVVTGLALSAGPTSRRVVVGSTSLPAGTLPAGPVVPLEFPGPLAVGPNGALYIADEQRDEVLVRLGDGQFRVVVGDGRVGFAGDGGPATKAELSDVSDLVFGPDGDLYIADGGRVRVVDHAGTIRTIAGNGSVAKPGAPTAVASGTPALSASLGSRVSIAFGPSGRLYLATASQLFRLSPGGKLVTIDVRVPGAPFAPFNGKLVNYGQIAIDAHGDIYASSTATGWSLYRITPDGVATKLGIARRSGGSTATVQLAPGRVVETGNASSILRVEGSKLVTSYAFDHVRGTNWFSLTYFAVGPHGEVYADDDGPAFQPVQQLVAVSHGHVVQLWRHGKPRS